MKPTRARGMKPRAHTSFPTGLHPPLNRARSSHERATRAPRLIDRSCVRVDTQIDMPHVAAYGIVVIQALFFFLGGVRDQFMTGKTIMPDEEYLQSWWHDTKLGDAENHSPRMEVIVNAWGTFIATIALLKIAVALTGGNSALAKTAGAIFCLTNLRTMMAFYPAQALMEAHWTNKKNNPAMVNKGDVMGFVVMLGVEAILWPIAQGGFINPAHIKME